MNVVDVGLFSVFGKADGRLTIQIDWAADSGEDGRLEISQSSSGRFTLDTEGWDGVRARKILEKFVEQVMEGFQDE